MEIDIWIVMLLRGIVVGLLVSIPLGPVGVLCIQRTLSKNRRSGFASGLGAATADTLFATVAFFFLSMVVSFIESNMVLVKVVGGICVVIVGVHIFMANPAVQIRRNRAGRSNLWQDYISVLLITLANPALVLVFVALFAAFGIDSTAGLPKGLFMIAGVFGGACSWWFLLTMVVNLVRRKFRPRHLLWINRVSGAVIVILGAAAILSIFINVNSNGNGVFH
ncbi:MAG: LysE family transporter [Rikenellaceae bacterium]|nr:LysE family transporter [Rikenellaceae bacterium]